MSAAQVVRDFFDKVRSGKELEAVHEVMADRVLAHQVQSEKEVTVERSPADYANHVREMIESYGEFSLTVEHFLAHENQVYVRWKQIGTHLGEIDGFVPTGKPIVEIASAVYRVEVGKIVEYWIQIDREGMRVQLERNAKISVAIQASEE